MGEETNQNLYTAFVGEAKAYFRLMAYAQKAAAEELPQIARLFRAVAAAEAVHARRSLELLGEVVVKDSETNLQASFEREEKAAGLYYPKFIRQAEEEGERRAAISFSHSRDVDEQHAGLYKRALDHLITDTTNVYHVCQTCGYVAEGEPPDECPICGVGREHFQAVD
ncbi:MAG: rubrerythrin family protein [Chloroflexia bacterium]|nr:rubrerythrin family protein [Chloroflexia bacterium]